MNLKAGKPQKIMRLSVKIGDLVRLYDNRVGIIVAYHKQYDGFENGYPWYVWVNGRVNYYQTKHLELA